MGGWVGNRVRLDTVVEANILPLPGIELQGSAIPTDHPITNVVAVC
jgi:hypothetical protein